MKTVVLLSGGLDSAVLLADEVLQGNEVTTISFDYMQTHSRELTSARNIAKHYGVPHRIVGMGSVVLRSALTGYCDIPTVHADDPDSTTVPARNVIFLAIAAAIAESEKASAVLIGANKDDEGGYVDCRPEFFEAMGKAVGLGTDSGVSILTPFLHWPKSEIVTWGLYLGVPFDLTWSCYRGKAEACNDCGACISRNQAMERGAREYIPGQ